LLQEYDVDHWMFAAPQEINAAILDHVETRWNDRLERNIFRDLVNQEASVLEEHFGMFQTSGVTKW